MINKRLLIKNLLAHNDESSFYDKKLQINIGSKEGKAKFLKHICALSNSNPNNNSYIVIGVDDQYNHIIGVDFFDDSKIQNLINAYLSYPPIIQYENIPGDIVNQLYVYWNVSESCNLDISVACSLPPIYKSTSFHDYNDMAC